MKTAICEALTALVVVAYIFALPVLAAAWR